MVDPAQHVEFHTHIAAATGRPTCGCARWLARTKWDTWHHAARLLILPAAPRTGTSGASDQSVIALYCSGMCVHLGKDMQPYLYGAICGLEANTAASGVSACHGLSSYHCKHKGSVPPSGSRVVRPHTMLNSCFFVPAAPLLHVRSTVEAGKHVLRWPGPT